MLEGFLKGLEQPEYIHVLINPLPVYGLAMGLAGLMIGLALRSREARTGALALILIAAASAWPVLHYGQQGYDRVKGMVDSEGENWLEEHMHRGEQLIYVFYALGAVALVSIGAEWKRPKAALPFAITTLVLATVALGIGGYIAHAGGQIRHKEFRFEPAPELRTDEHRVGNYAE
jgi:hypothetical protein